MGKICEGRHASTKIVLQAIATYICSYVIVTPQSELLPKSEVKSRKQVITMILYECSGITGCIPLSNLLFG